MAEAWRRPTCRAGVVNLRAGRARRPARPCWTSSIDALMFTGSGAAGAHFRRKFADDPHVILALELGGNNPLVVWDAADAEAVAGHRGPVGLRHHRPALLLRPPPDRAGGRRGRRHRRGRRRPGRPADLRRPGTRRPSPMPGPLISAARRRARAAQAAAAADRLRREGRSAPPGQSTACPAPSSSPAIIDVTGVETCPTRRCSRRSCQVTRVPDFDAAIDAGQRHPLRPVRRAGQRRPGELGPLHPPHPRRASSTSTARPPGRRATCPSAASAPAATTGPAPTTPPTTAPIRWPASRPTGGVDPGRDAGVEGGLGFAGRDLAQHLE